MTLRVGPYLYHVRFVDGLIHHDGQPCVGLCDNDAKVIHVSTTLCEAEQIQTICHEYMEAWIYHFGDQATVDATGSPHPRPTGQASQADLLADPRKEAWCDLFGLAMTQFVVDWMHQVKVFAHQSAPDTAAQDDPTQGRAQAGSAPASPSSRGAHPHPRSAPRRAPRPARPARPVSPTPTPTPTPTQRHTTACHTPAVRMRDAWCPGPDHEVPHDPRTPPPCPPRHPRHPRQAPLWRIRVFESVDHRN